MSIRVLAVSLLLVFVGACAAPGDDGAAGESGAAGEGGAPGTLADGDTTHPGAEDDWSGAAPPPAQARGTQRRPTRGFEIPTRPHVAGFRRRDELLQDAPGGVPSFVVVLLDDLGAGDPGFAGHPLHRTPNMDRLAAEGVVFTDAYAAAPNCAPSRASLLTGLWTPRHGVYTVGSSTRGRAEHRRLIPVRNTPHLDESLVTLPERLRAGGWTTASIGKWHLGSDPRRHGFDLNVAGDAQGHPRQYFSPFENKHLSEGRMGEYLVDRMAQEAVDFLHTNRERPFFLYLSHFAVHTPIRAPQDRVDAVRARPGAEDFDPTYAAMVESADLALGRVLDTLEELGRDDDTVVLFLSDNGGHGRYARHPVLRGSKGQLYEGGLRVPLVVRWPGAIEPGVSHAPVSGVDLAPTILDLAGADPRDAKLDGTSLAPLLFATADPDRPPRPLFWHFPAYLESGGVAEGPWRTTPAGAIRLGDLKLIEWFEDGALELYDLAADPGETHDLAEERAGVTARMAGMLAAWRDSVRAPMPVPKEGFASDWKGLPDRRWIGPDWFANRWADWRVQGGRVECTEGSEKLPLRTLQLLTRTLDPAAGPVTLRVRTGPMTTAPADPEGTWAGFVFGHGGPDVDPRITALVHHRPGEDGGLLAVVDGGGSARVRDNSGPSTARSAWSVGGRLAEGEVPELAAPVRADIDPRTEPEAYELELTLARVEDADAPGAALTGDARAGGGSVDADLVVAEIKVFDAESGHRLSHARMELPAERVAGGIGLLSHGGGAGGWWFDRLRITGEGLRSHPDRAWGPVLSVLYTVSDGVLQLTAQLPPLGPRDTADAALQVQREDGEWELVDVGHYDPVACIVPFRVAGWDEHTDTRYRVVYELRTGLGPRRTAYEGRLRPAPTGDLTVASLNCQKIYTGELRWNEDGIWFPHADTVAALRHHDPDLLFFAGDQIYEGDLTPVVTAPLEEAMLDYLYKWSRFCWSFGALTRDRPTVCIPDDHDVYHGNLWGEGGRRALKRDGLSAQDAGGYKQPGAFVNLVHATQTSHLPDPPDPEPALQGIEVYFTALRWGGTSWAILADRMFKSAPGPLLPEGRVSNGWFENGDFDPVADGDPEGAVLLGDRQLAFLRDWARDWSGGTWIKGVLSQTLFANVATLPPGAWNGEVLPGVPIPEPGAYPEGWQLAADCDSNGWPRSGRDRAVAAMREASAFHLAGDQHLPSTIQYGVERHGEGAWAFCAPAIANTWPRRWFPPEPGDGRADGAPAWTGDFEDGFGNRMTVAAVANPVVTGLQPARLHDRVPGYGLVRLERDTREVVFECWPRAADPTRPEQQYAGWPVRFHQFDNSGAASAAWWLPPLRFEGLADPVVQLLDAEGKVLRTVRALGDTHRAHVDAPGTYGVRLGDPDRGAWVTLDALEAEPADAPSAERVVRFDG